MADVQPDPELGPPAESIHMPDPSYLPIALAIGILMLVPPFLLAVGSAI